MAFDRDVAVAAGDGGEGKKAGRRTRERREDFFERGKGLELRWQEFAIRSGKMAEWGLPDARVVIADAVPVAVALSEVNGAEGTKHVFAYDMKLLLFAGYSSYSSFCINEQLPHLAMSAAEKIGEESSTDRLSSLRRSANEESFAEEIGEEKIC
ncbi:hypothetical protein Drorol1_Dr00008827 [Drosera rotundifolia]